MKRQRITFDEAHLRLDAVRCVSLAGLPRNRNTSEKQIEMDSRFDHVEVGFQPDPLNSTLSRAIRPPAIIFRQ